MKTMHKESFRFAAAPDSLTRVKEPLSFMRRGADAHGAYADSLALSRSWSVTAQGNSVPVYAVPVARCGPHSFCRLELLQTRQAAQLRVDFTGTLRAVRVEPQHKGVAWHQENNALIFSIDAPCSFTIEANGRMNSPLTVLIELPEQDTPAPNDPDVIWFEPGLHEVSSVQLRTGQTLYLAAGAVLKAVPPQGEAPLIEGDWAGRANYADFIRAENCNNIRVLGRGIIDLSALDWHARRTLCFTKCQDVVVDGPVLLGAAHWTVAFFSCKDITLQNLILFGYRENSDGIDLVNCQRAHVSNCYIRTGDDAVCIKAMEPPPAIGGKDILVERCTIWNDKVRGLGIAGESRGEICDVIFRQCTVLHSLADWAQELGALCVVLCDAGTAHDIVFEDIVVLDERSNGINCMLFRDRWSTDKEAGHIYNIRFKNIRLPHNTPVRLWGYDETHKVKSIALQNVTTATGEPLWLDCNEFTETIECK